jgi:hypothetical protein
MADSPAAAGLDSSRQIGESKWEKKQVLENTNFVLRVIQFFDFVI